MSPNIKDEVEGNIYFDIISECKNSVLRTGQKLNFISSGAKTAGTSTGTPVRSELEGELSLLLAMINELKDSIIK